MDAYVPFRSNLASDPAGNRSFGMGDDFHRTFPITTESLAHPRARIAHEMSRLCSSRFERAARQMGWTRVAGIDEAGRGALFGPVVAAAVILNPKRRIVGLDDSKKLPAERRTELAVRIKEHALAWAVAEVDAQRIDAWNIYQASRQAMTAALQQLTCSLTPCNWMF
jgi:ribonuclease HII